MHWKNISHPIYTKKWFTPNLRLLNTANTPLQHLEYLYFTPQGCIISQKHCNTEITLCLHCDNTINRPQMTPSRHPLRCRTPFCRRHIAATRGVCARCVDLDLSCYMTGCGGKSAAFFIGMLWYLRLVEVPTYIVIALPCAIMWTNNRQLPCISCIRWTIGIMTNDHWLRRSVSKVWVASYTEQKRVI